MTSRGRDRGDTGGDWLPMVMTGWGWNASEPPGWQYTIEQTGASSTSRKPVRPPKRKISIALQMLRPIPSRYKRGGGLGVCVLTFPALGYKKRAPNGRSSYTYMWTK